MSDKPAMNANPRRRRLKTIGNLRAMVAQVLRDLETGKAEPERARAMLYGAQILGKLIEGEDVEKRLRELEQEREREREPGDSQRAAPPLLGRGGEPGNRGQRA